MAFTNRFINAAGGAEMRQGLQALGSAIAGGPTLDAIHELVKSDGTSVIMVSGQGVIYSLSGATWSQVHSVTSTETLQSVQMGDKLIFCNGVDRNFYTEDAVTFTDLTSVITQGTIVSVSGSALTTAMSDGNVGDWVSETDVAVNDIIYNATQDAYGIITEVVSGAATASTYLRHTAIGTAATGIGIATDTPQVGDDYKIIDLIELNIVPTNLDDDNAATLTSGSTTSQIRVSAVSDWTTTEVRAGDFIRNTTREAVTQVTAVTSAYLGVHGITSQTVGDSILLFKDSMPISKRLHVHFGRLYHIDGRDQRQVLASGPNDPTNMVDGATIDTTLFKFGELQSSGDIAVDMSSYQRFFVIGGKKSLFFFQGTDPTTGGDFSPIGLFPQGVVAPDGMVSIGNDVAFVTRDGVQSVSLVGDASTLGRANISEAIKTTLRDEIANTSDIFAFHYPRRSWFGVKVGSQVYIFNYTAYFGQDNLQRGSLATTEGSWSLFDGKFAQQKAFFVRSNGDLVTCGIGGLVYLFDQGDYDDDGTIYDTKYQTGWLTLSEPRKSVRRKAGKYIKPIIESSTNIVYTIQAEGSFSNVESYDTVVVTAAGGAAIGSAVIGDAAIGGAPIVNEKIPLRWRGETVRLTFTTPGGAGPDILSRYTLYHTTHGKR